MHEKNCFITLTYAPEHVPPKLDYSDFQKFMKRLRKLQNEPMGVFVTGEYGEKTKRPHWHAIVFGWEPPDLEYLRPNERGDRVYTSETLDRVWSKGFCESGSVTFESAGYVARYAAKKLVHGPDQSHDYQPISRKSNKHAIGKKWLETYWEDIFRFGIVEIGGRPVGSVPRYYEKWLKENRPDDWVRYVTQAKANKIALASDKALKEALQYRELLDVRGWHKPNPLTRLQIKKMIKRQKFKQLQDYLKL